MDISMDIHEKSVDMDMNVILSTATLDILLKSCQQAAWNSLA